MLNARSLRHRLLVVGDRRCFCGVNFSVIIDVIVRNRNAAVSHRFVMVRFSVIVARGVGEPRNEQHSGE